MIRAFIRWLAQDEIEHEVELVKSRERLDCALAVELHERTGYLRGYAKGAEEAFDRLDAAMHSRADGEDGYIPEDIEQAKKGMVH